MLAIDRAGHYHSEFDSGRHFPCRFPGDSEDYVKRLKTRSHAAALAAVLCTSLSSLAAPAGDPDRGASLGTTCLGCHGVTGYRNAYPSYRVPKLGGQRAGYLKTALEAYRDGTRPHPTMQAQGSALSDQDIDDVVAWITSAGTAGDDVDARAVADLKAAQPCIACHGPAGADVTPTPPVLSGQYRDYLEQALARYREQARGMTVMNSFAATLTDDDIARIARFYSSLNGLDTLGRDRAQREAR